MDVEVDGQGRAGFQNAVPRAEPEVHPEQLILPGHREGSVVEVHLLTPTIGNSAFVGIVSRLRQQEHVRSLVANAEQNEERPQKQHCQDDLS